MSVAFFRAAPSCNLQYSFPPHGKFTPSSDFFVKGEMRQGYSFKRENVRYGAQQGQSRRFVVVRLDKLIGRHGR